MSEPDAFAIAHRAVARPDIPTASRAAMAKLNAAMGQARKEHA